MFRVVSIGLKADTFWLYLSFQRKRKRWKEITQEKTDSFEHRMKMTWLFSSHSYTHTLTHWLFIANTHTTHTYSSLYHTHTHTYTHTHTHSLSLSLRLFFELRNEEEEADCEEGPIWTMMMWKKHKMSFPCVHRHFVD